jgi:hypothetical protein
VTISNICPILKIPVLADKALPRKVLRYSSFLATENLEVRNRKKKTLTTTLLYRLVDVEENGHAGSLLIVLPNPAGTRLMQMVNRLKRPI